VSVAVDVYERFSGNLLRLRKQANLSQEGLAIRASLHRTEIGKLENRERLPRLDTLVKLAGALAVPSARLMDGITWEPGRSEAGRFEFRPGDGFRRLGED
jgi:transcriptional regulator with XRE-family HTH domain